MALLSTQQMTSAGAAITLASATGGGDTADISNGRTFLWVKNGAGSPVTVTLTTPGVIDGDLAVADRAVSVTNGTEKLIGPLRPDVYGGVVAIAYSAATSVTVAAVSC